MNKGNLILAVTLVAIACCLVGVVFAAIDYQRYSTECRSRAEINSSMCWQGSYGQSHAGYCDKEKQQAFSDCLIYRV
jgi:hypothetical protein